MSDAMTPGKMAPDNADDIARNILWKNHQEYCFECARDIAAALRAYAAEARERCAIIADERHDKYLNAGITPHKCSIFAASACGEIASQIRKGKKQ